MSREFGVVGTILGRGCLTEFHWSKQSWKRMEPGLWGWWGGIGLRVAAASDSGQYRLRYQEVLSQDLAVLHGETALTVEA